MEELNFDLDMLARETLLLTEQIESSNPFSNNSQNPFTEEDDDLLDELPDSQGLVFRIQRSEGTFCIRGLATESIKDTFSKLEEGDQKVVNKLKLTSVEDCESIEFFETNSFNHAHLIYREIFNRRYPYFEDQLCNISDPGFSWWMNILEDGIRIQFKSHGLDQDYSLVQLGPLGDARVASKFLRETQSFFTKLIPFKEFSVTDKTFEVRVEDINHPTYQKILNIFLEGELIFNPTDYSELPNGEVVFEFFQRLCVLRSFWIFINDSLCLEERYPLN